MLKKLSFFTVTSELNFPSLWEPRAKRPWISPGFAIPSD